MNIANYEKLVLSAPFNERSTIYQLAKELSDKNFGKGPGGTDSPAHKLIFRTMLSLHQDSKPIDVATVAKRLGKDLELVGGEAYLAEISQTMSVMGIGSVEGLGEWATVVDNAGRLRQLSGVLNGYTRRLEDIEKALPAIGNVDDFFARLMEEIGGTSRVQSTYRPIGQACAEFRRDIEGEIGGQAVSWLPMGWEATKKYKLLPRSSLVIIMGLSSIGKSQLLAQFLLGAAIQIKAFDLSGVCILNTYEMKGKKYVGRMASSLCGVDLQDTALHNKDSDEFIRLMEATEFIESLPIMWDEGDMTSTQVITQSISLAAEMGGVHVLGVDYVELLPDKGPSEELRVSQVYKNTQSLSRSLDGCVIDLSQVSGEAFSSDTRIAGAWGTRYSKAGWFMAELELEVYNPKQMKSQGISFRLPDYLTEGVDTAYVLVHKNKNGPTGWFPLKWEAEYTRFSDPAMLAYGMSEWYENIDKIRSDF